MAGTPLTRTLYDQLVEAFRTCPGNFSQAARAVGVDRRMATRAWRKGWPRYQWALPIERVLAEEQTAAQAHRAQLREAAKQESDAQREAAKAQSVMAMSEEMRMVEGARKAVIGSLVLALDLLPAMRTLAKIVVDGIKDGRFGKPGAEKVIMEILQRHTAMMDKATRAADAVVKLSRLNRGAPTANIGIGNPNGGPIMVGGPNDMTDEELTHDRAVEIVSLSADILEEVRKSGGLPADLELALTGGVDESAA